MLEAYSFEGASMETDSHDRYAKHDYTKHPSECRRCRLDTQAYYEQFRRLDPAYAEQWRNQFQRWFVDRRDD